MRITIKKGSIKTQMDRSDLVEVKPTHDGVVFNFKHGLHLYYTDSYMPQTAKQLMQAGPDNFKGDMEFDLDNYHTPIKVSATK